MNRSKITRHRGQAMIRRGIRSGSAPQQTSILKRKAPQPPAEAVKAKKSRPAPNSADKQLTQLMKGVEHFRANRNKAENKGSEKELQQQVHTLTQELKFANNLKESIKDIIVSNHLKEYNLGDDEVSGLTKERE
ncbi:hypothetical protein GZ77_17925 [Endozoicomonas montiporae]|uniref:Uncharacterized protein n=2 Tax=Endozoicomonas montiporae TaxID=1027273 RepID=A0A081N1U2_9GAMM|nr:hypothetical protein [Endozoicomonas montiporae]AMO58643.1 hypothetical protein EZMO1_4742 [Endozoicomonas montiporae CL-33]KEQ12415.1 hypothetical protein GZ77_17925 [Endozoicomonas montiporae]